MKTAFSLTLLGLMFLLNVGCGAVFIGGAIKPTTVVQGMVTSVQLGNANQSDGSTQVTFVTFFQSGTFSTLTFCNNQINQFPLNQTVSVNFNPGAPCATIVVVTFIA